MSLTPAHLRTMRHRISYGLPLTIEEQRWLVEQATGEKIDRLNRCPACNAEGTVLVPDCEGTPRGEKRRCEACGGFGYVAGE